MKKKRIKKRNKRIKKQIEEGKKIEYEKEKIKNNLSKEYILYIAVLSVRSTYRAKFT